MGACVGTILYFTDSDIFHMQKQALMKAQQNQMGLLAESILMYMQAVKHPQLAIVRTQLGLSIVVYLLRLYT